MCYETLRSSSIINRRELILIIKTTTKKESTLGEQEKKNLKTKIQKSPETLKSGDNNLLKQWQANWTICSQKLNLQKVFQAFAESTANQAYTVTYLTETRKYINRIVHIDIAVSSKSLINDPPLKEVLFSSNIQLSQNQLAWEILSLHIKL